MWLICSYCSEHGFKQSRAAYRGAHREPIQALHEVSGYLCGHAYVDGGKRRRETMRRQTCYNTFRSWESPVFGKRKQEFLGRTKRLLPLIRHGPHRKRHLQQFIVAAGTCLPGSCLATIGGYTDLHTLLLCDMGCRKNDAYNNSSIVACIICEGTVSTEPLPSNDKRWYTYRHRMRRGV
jgi:hypothetical protein